MLLEPDEARLAVGDGPGEGHGLAVGLGRERSGATRTRPALGVLRSTTVIPRGRASVAALTRFTRSSVSCSSRPAQHRRDQRRRVVRGRLAGDLEGQRAGRARAASWAANRPSVSASGRYGAIAWAVSAVSSGALTA